MMPGPVRDIADFVPHRGSMLLLDRLVDCDEVHGTAEVSISRRSSFYLPGRGVPAYVGVEYMAQAVAAFDGAQRRAAGAGPAIGFLLGTRQFRSTRSYFRDGERLTVRVTMIYRDGPLGSFDCAIELGGETCCTATLNVYRPGEGEAMAPMDGDRENHA